MVLYIALCQGNRKYFNSMNLNTHIRFRIGGKKGLLQFKGTVIPEFAGYIRESAYRGTPDFTIIVDETADSKFSLELVSGRIGFLHVAPGQNMHPYGLMTAFKALLQALLIDKHVVLFHGKGDGAGRITVNGMDTGWWDRMSEPESKYRRLAVVAKQKDGYHEFHDFLRDGLTSGAPLKAVRTPGDGRVSEEELFKSTWFFFFFSHFFGKQRERFLPQEMTQRMRDLLIDFRKSLAYNRGMSYVRNSAFKAKKLEKEVVIFDPAGNRIITLNETGRLIWSYLWKPRTGREVVGHVAERYGMETAEVRKDIESFLKRAVRSRIVKSSKD